MADNECVDLYVGSQLSRQEAAQPVVKPSNELRRTCANILHILRQSVCDRVKLSWRVRIGRRNPVCRTREH